MRSLNRKLLRDCWKLRGQVIAIGLVVASGVAVMVMSLSALQSLQVTAETYYDRYRFAQVFASLERAPENLVRRIYQIPGVQTVQTRIVKLATVSVEGFEEPVIGQIISVPENKQPLLNLLALRKGRFVSPGHPDEVVINESFAEAHDLNVGDQIEAVLNGNRRRLSIVGLALSPEYVYAIGPGALMPDDHRFGIVWMGQSALAAAFDLDGAFNNVSLALLRNTNPKQVIAELDTLLERYGGVGAIARKDQVSNWFLQNELIQLRHMANILPAIFIAVAAFLTQMVLARLITIERSEIGLLKAFGYSGARIGLHYFLMVIVIISFGILLGWGVGAWLGFYNTQLYSAFFRFPFLYFEPSPSTFIISSVITLAAALIGTGRAVRRAAVLPPAEAMRPPAPAEFHQRTMKSNGWFSWLDQPTRIILRQISRWPLRSLFTTVGIALSVGVLVMSLQWVDSIREIIGTYFYDAQKQDVTVALVDSEQQRILNEFGRLPGVMHAEPARIVSAEFYQGHRFHRGAINGVPEQALLMPVYDNQRGVIAVPDDGLVLGSALAKKLNVQPGDSVWVHLLEGKRPKLNIPVVEVVESYIGMPAYLSLDSLNRSMKETQQIGLVNLRVDTSFQEDLYKELKKTPKVAAVMVKEGAINTFENTMAETILIFISFFTVFACALAFGLVYNSARVALSERGRELATLRVLGFSQLEISYILLGEMALFVVVSLPLGCLAGYGLAWLITALISNELYRIPLIIDPDSYGVSMGIILLAAVVSAAVVQSRINRLDLIEVLKTRE